MTDRDRWSATAAALPTAGRAERERPFWEACARTFAWRRVADAGCGAGFHLSLLRGLGVETFGFDVALPALKHVANVVAGDLGSPPLQAAAFDAVLCLGNTISLLASRQEQRRAVASLATLVRPGGLLLVQGEGVGALVAAGPVARTRALANGGVHLRVFERRGRHVRMLAGVIHSGVESVLESTLLLPTPRRAALRLARAAGLRPVALPVEPPSGAATWWAALSAPSPGS